MSQLHGKNLNEKGKSLKFYFNLTAILFELQFYHFMKGGC